MIQIGYSVKLLESYCIKRFTNDVAIYEITAIVSFIFSRNYMLNLRFIHFYICNQFSLKKGQYNKIVWMTNIASIWIIDMNSEHRPQRNRDI